MPERGPIPMPDELRQRRNDSPFPVDHISDEDLASLPIPIDLNPTPPASRDDWCDEARELWEAIQVDPAALWMGPAAWAFAKVMCSVVHLEFQERVTAVLQPGRGDDSGEIIREVVPMKGATINALLKWAAANGFHLQDRLRMFKDVEFHQNRRPGDPNSVGGTVVPITAKRSEALRSKPAASE